jgi:signal recognition particle receptor subunit beta
MAEEYKILITGTMGAGKTTAICAVSQMKVVSTDVHNMDRTESAKATTTVGLDYGEVTIGDGAVLRLYGTPGQARFRFMWEILAKGALGLIVLVDNSRKSPLEDLTIYLDNFRPLVDKGAVVVGVGRSETHPAPGVDDYYEYLSDRGLMLPVLSVDVRQREEVLMLFDVLFSVLELADG